MMLDWLIQLLVFSLFIAAVYPGPEPEPRGPVEGIEPPGQGGPTPPAGGGTPSGGVVPTPRQSGGSVDLVGSIPTLNVPSGNFQMIREGATRFRVLIDRFEGVDIKRSPTEIGELQAVKIKNALTDEQTLRKIGGSADVNSSGAVGVVGIHEVSGLREMTLQACDDSTPWVESDAANFTKATETTIKAEGAASLKMTVSGAGGNNDTILFDLGGGGLDLSVFDHVEVMLRGLVTAGNSVDFGVSEDNVLYYEVPFVGTSTVTWVTLRIDLSGIPVADRNAIRFLRFKATNGATAQIWYADIIRAVKRVQHRIRMIRTSGTSTGGIRDYPGNVTLQLDSDESGAWAPKGDIFPALANTKMRAVDWFGTTFIMLGTAGALKYENGVFKAWEEAPPSKFLAMHYDKLWALSQEFDPHGLRHTTVNSTTIWPLDTDPIGGDGGLFYVGRRHGYFPTGLKSLFGQLFIWTEGDLWILTGSDNNSFALKPDHPGAGTLSHESIAAFDRGVIWHDGIGNRILMWQNGGPVNVGLPIQSDLKAIPDGRKPWTAGAFDGRFYYFSYTRAGQTLNDRTWVLDTELYRWHGPFEGSWAGFTSGYMGLDGLLYLGTDGNGVRKIPSGNTDNGAAIALSVKSAALNFRFPRWQKRLRRCAIKCQDFTGTLTLKFYRDLSPTAVRTYSLTYTGGPAEVQAVQIHEDVRGDLLQWEIEESSVNPLVINELMLDGNLVRRIR